MKSANSINKSDKMKGLLFRSALIALLAIPGVAEAGARTDLPTCDKAKETLAKDNRKKVKTWAEKTCKCTVSLKRKLDRIGPRFQDSYDEECGKKVLSAKPPRKIRPPKRGQPERQPEVEQSDGQPEDKPLTPAQQIRKLIKETNKLISEKEWDEAEAKANEILELQKKNKFAKRILKQIAEGRKKEIEQQIKNLTDEIKELMEEKEETKWDEVETKANEILKLDKENKFAKEVLGKIPANLALLWILLSMLGVAGIEYAGRKGNSRFKEAIKKLQEEKNPDLAECVGEKYEPTEPVKQGRCPIIGTGMNLFVKNPRQFNMEAEINNDLRRKFEAKFGKDPLPHKQRSQRNR